MEVMVTLQRSAPNCCFVEENTINITPSSLAYKASTYLQSLLDQGAIVPDPNVGLDEIYAKYAVHPPPNPSEISEKATDDQERLLFRREAIPRIVNFFDLPSSATSDLYRAVDQTAVRLKKKENP